MMKTVSRMTIVGFGTAMLVLAALAVPSGVAAFSFASGGEQIALLTDSEADSVRGRSVCPEIRVGVTPTCDNQNLTPAGGGCAADDIYTDCNGLSCRDNCTAVNEESSMITGQRTTGRFGFVACNALGSTYNVRMCGHGGPWGWDCVCNGPIVTAGNACAAGAVSRVQPC